jgi:hypothetical protein
MARIGGGKWHVECAEKQGKFVPVESREGYVSKKAAEAPAAAPPEETQPDTTEEATAEGETQEVEEAEEAAVAE